MKTYDWVALLGFVAVAAVVGMVVAWGTPAFWPCVAVCLLANLAAAVMPWE